MSSWLWVVVLSGCGVLSRSSEAPMPAEPVAVQAAPSPSPAAVPAPAPPSALPDPIPACAGDLGALPTDETHRDEAINDAGMRCYDAGDLDGARALFEVTSGTTALPLYNLACTILLQRRQDGNACDREAYMDAALGYLLRAARLDPGRRERMPKDTDLDDVRQALRYKVALGLDLDDRAAVEAALPGLEFWSSGGGAYGPSRVIEFEPAGVLSVDMLGFDDDGMPTWSKVKSTWTIEDGRIRIGLDTDLLWPHEEGTLRTSGGDRKYFDAPDECSA